MQNNTGYFHILSSLHQNMPTADMISQLMNCFLRYGAKPDISARWAPSLHAYNPVDDMIDKTEHADAQIKMIE